ncbi:pilus (MSHA type) biogenesis protein MshL, partial [Vibrio parahaemolyticus VPTS-2010_2]
CQLWVTCSATLRM